MNKLLLTIFTLFLFLHMTPAQEIKPLSIGDHFPSLKGELLSFQKFEIPKDCKGKVSLLIVAFKRGTQPQIDTWTKEILPLYDSNEEFLFLEVPMISGMYSWMSSYIDNGMRSGIQKKLHDNVLTYYGSLSDYYKYFGVDDKKTCYLFLLDKEGKVQLMKKGNANPESMKELRVKTDLLLKK